MKGVCERVCVTGVGGVEGGLWGGWVKGVCGGW